MATITKNNRDNLVQRIGSFQECWSGRVECLAYINCPPSAAELEEAAPLAALLAENGLASKELRTFRVMRSSRHLVAIHESDTCTNEQQARNTACGRLREQLERALNGSEGYLVIDVEPEKCERSI